MLTSNAKAVWRAVLLTAGAAVFSFVAMSQASSQQGDDKDDVPPPPCQTFVGAIEGGPASARIGIVTEKGNFLLYMCSQEQKFNESFSRWLRGKIGESGAIDAASPDGVKVTASVKGDTVEGEVSGPGGMALKFAAKKVAACMNAGLYRATDKVDGDDMVAGWIVDSKDAVAGSVQNKKKNQVQPAPKLGALNNNLAAPGGNVNAEKVSSALKAGDGTKGKNPLGKIDPATRAENLQDLSARFQGKNGSPLQAAFINVLRRAQAGAKGTDPLDSKLLSIAAKINPNTAKKYIDNWDRLPGNLRSRLLGTSADLASGKTSLTTKNFAAIAASLPKKGGTSPQPAKGSVKSVQIRQLVCVDETNPEFVGSDEIFVIYTAIQGQTVFDPVKTKIYTGLDTGKTAQFTGADVTVFPPPGKQPGQGDIEIAASIFEDDSADQAVIAELLKGATEVAVEILKAAGKDGAVDVTKSLGDFFDSVVAAFPSTQFLGSDAIVVRPNGQITSVAGQAKTQMTVQRFRNNGNRLFRYDLKNIQVFQ